jgi:hypothetical protein
MRPLQLADCMDTPSLSCGRSIFFTVSRKGMPHNYSAFGSRNTIGGLSDCARFDGKSGSGIRFPVLRC